jgi:hypothetical protein
MSCVGIFTCRYTNIGITMDKLTIEGCTKPTVQDRPHLARSGRTTARPGCSLARLGRTRAGRSWPQPAAARPEQAAAGHSWPHLARARPDRTSRCAHTYQMPRLGSTAPTIPRISLGWTRDVDSMSVRSKR